MRKKISNELLAKLYFGDGLSLLAIGRMKKVSRATLYFRLKRLGLTLRTRKEAGELRKRKNLEEERKRIRGVLLQCLLSGDDIDGLMSRYDAIAQELKASGRAS